MDCSGWRRVSGEDVLKGLKASEEGQEEGKDVSEFTKLKVIGLSYDHGRTVHAMKSPENGSSRCNVSFLSVLEGICTKYTPLLSY